MKRIEDYAKTALKNSFTIGKYSHAPLNKARRYTLFIIVDRPIRRKNHRIIKAISSVAEQVFIPNTEPLNLNKRFTQKPFEMVFNAIAPDLAVS